MISIILSIGMLAACGVAVFRSAGAADLVWLSPTGFLLVVMLQISAAGLAAWRLQSVARDMGYRLSVRDAVAALGLGQVGSALFFQLAGQIAARGAFLRDRQVPVAGSVIMVGYERVAALLVSMALAGLGALLVFGHITLQIVEAATLVRLAVGLLLVVLVSGALVWGAAVRPVLVGLRWRHAAAFGRCLAQSLAIQLVTMACYLVALHDLSPGVPLVPGAAAVALVMFAASLPISFAGWGVRELSAIAALGAIGVAPEVAFSVALLVGLVSLATAMACAALGRAAQPLPVPAEPAKALNVPDYSRMLDAVLPVAAAIAVLFQVVVPTQSGRLSVNLADPIGLLGGALLLMAWWRGRLRPAWVRGIGWMIAATTAGLLWGFAVGYLRFGSSEWAVVNRLFGWCVLLGLGATGALLAQRFDRRGLLILEDTFVVGAATLALADAVLLVLAAYFPQVPRELVRLPIEGLSQNRNAFALMLVLALGLALAHRSDRHDRVAVLLAAGLWLTGSRAGLAGGGMVVVLALVTRVHTFASVLKGSVLAVTVAALSLMPRIGSSGHHLEATSFGLPISVPSSDLLRGELTRQAVTLWLQNPITGAGLGAFLVSEAGLPKEQQLVIHSTPLWLLTECGLIGIAGFVAVALALARRALQEAWRDPQARGLLFIGAGFAVMSMAHELLYQRAVWLLLGCLVALPMRERGSLPE